MHKEIKLLPCPFCGSRDVGVSRDDCDGASDFYYFSCCMTCLARGPEFCESIKDHEQNARQAWNDRK